MKTLTQYPCGKSDQDPHRSAIRRAEQYRTRSLSALAPLREALQQLLAPDDTDIFYQNGDGWCVLFGNDENTPVFKIDFTTLLKMSRDDATAYLRERSI